MISSIELCKEIKLFIQMGPITPDTINIAQGYASGRRIKDPIFADLAALIRDFANKKEQEAVIRDNKHFLEMQQWRQR